MGDAGDHADQGTAHALVQSALQVLVDNPAVGAITLQVPVQDAAFEITVSKTLWQGGDGGFLYEFAARVVRLVRVGSRLEQDEGWAARVTPATMAEDADSRPRAARAAYLAAVAAITALLDAEATDA